MDEALAVIFSLFSVLLTSKNNKLCWPIGILGVIGFMIIFYQTKDWGNFFLQFVFLFQSFKGWFNWNKEDSKIINWTKREINLIIIIFPILLYYLISIGDLKWIDSITTSLSLIGIYLLSKKILQSWFFWISADILYILLFYQHKLYLSSLLYFIFLILAIYGFYNWKKLKQNENK